MLKNRFPFQLIDRLREEIAYWKRQYEEEHVRRVKMIRACRELEQRQANPIAYTRGQTVIVFRRKVPSDSVNLGKRSKPAVRAEQAKRLLVSTEQARRFVIPDDVRLN